MYRWLQSVRFQSWELQIKIKRKNFWKQLVQFDHPRKSFEKFNHLRNRFQNTTFFPKSFTCRESKPGRTRGRKFCKTISMEKSISPWFFFAKNRRLKIIHSLGNPSKMWSPLKYSETLTTRTFTVTFLEISYTH